MRKAVILHDAHAKLQDEFLRDLAARGEFYIKKELDEAKLAEVSQRTEVLIVSGGTYVRSEDLARLPKLKLIADFGVGYDKIDLAECRRRQIKVTNTPGVMKDDVADVAIGLMLNCVRQLVAAHNYTRQGHWLEHAYPLVRSVTGLKVGIAGLGRIGLEIAKRAEAFKTDIGYFCRTQKAVPYRYFSDLEALAAWCDVLIIITPATPQTRGMVDSRILDALGPQGYLINIARGSIVRQEELAAALREGRIAGAGLDVFEKEPQVPPEFLALPNLVLAPHIGSATHATRQAMASLVLENLDAYLEGRELVTPVPELACESK
ncbi:MAG: 2-hydroxyacid dehydrogenase [Succinivibrio sp.]|nr:2-hydroxyacid dehydrogenase [Succinivibrio sp.]